MYAVLRQVLEKVYWAGRDLSPTGTSLDYRTMEIKINELLPEVKEILDTLAARNAALKAVVVDLLEQHRRQDDVEDCATWLSYPDKFPEWGRAWENAAKVLFKGSE